MSYMLSEERRRAILDMLQSDGRVLVTDLAKHFRTSLITIRKDLESCTMMANWKEPMAARYR